MNFKRILILAVIVIALGALVGGWTNGAQTASRTAWEYKIIWLQPSNQGPNVEAQMNRLGDEGWELVTVDLAERIGGHHGAYVFKRAK